MPSPNDYLLGAAGHLGKGLEAASPYWEEMTPEERAIMERTQRNLGLAGDAQAPGAGPPTSRPDASALLKPGASLQSSYAQMVLRGEISPRDAAILTHAGIAPHTSVSMAPGSEGGLSEEALAMANRVPQGVLPEGLASPAPTQQPAQQASPPTTTSPSGATSKAATAVRGPSSPGGPRTRADFQRFMAGAQQMAATAPKRQPLEEALAVIAAKGNEGRATAQTRGAEDRKTQGVRNEGLLEVEGVRQEGAGERARMSAEERRADREQRASSFQQTLSLNKDRLAQQKLRDSQLFDRYRAMNARDRARAVASSEGVRDRAAVQRNIANLRNAAASMLRSAATPGTPGQLREDLMKQAQEMLKHSTEQERQWREVLGEDVLDMEVDDFPLPGLPVPGASSGDSSGEAPPIDVDTPVQEPHGARPRYKRAPDGSIWVKDAQGARRLA